MRRMWAVFRSECLKLKHSYTLYLLVSFGLLAYVSLPVYLLSTRASYALDAAIYFPMLAETLLASLVSILSMEQEEVANHFQNVKSSRQKGAIWLTKLVVIDLLFLVITFGLWLFLGLVQQDILAYVWIGFISWLEMLFLYHFHTLLALWLGRGGNFVVAFVECLFVLFASNKALLGIYLFPVALPINSLISSNPLYLLFWFFWFLLVTIIGFILVTRDFYRTGG